jgi:hypothetical protein
MGQFITRGSLAMTIPGGHTAAPWRRKLTIYLGVTNVTAQVSSRCVASTTTSRLPT